MKFGAKLGRAGNPLPAARWFRFMHVHELRQVEGTRISHKILAGRFPFLAPRLWSGERIEERGSSIFRTNLFSIPCLAALFLSASITMAQPPAPENRNSFVAITNFSNFSDSPGATPGEIILTSPQINTAIAWDELIASWNVPSGVWLKIEARAIYPDHTTKYYTLGLWSDDPVRHPRHSVREQQDADGTVKTDTLVLQRHGAQAQLRLTLGSFDSTNPPRVKFLGLSLCDSSTQPAPHEPNRAAWGKILDVPERRQAEYQGGNAWCSPASLSMVLAFWSETLHRPELDRPVPEVAAAVNDPAWDGSGNWPFNTAYAGALPGLRACVTRLDDISELEDWIAAGIPPVISVSSYLTHDRHSGQDNGHLIVCVGFTTNGDMVANDPGVSIKNNERARRVYPRDRVIEAWKKSKNTVYLIYPESAALPPDKFGHWEHDKTP